MKIHEKHIDKFLEAAAVTNKKTDKRGTAEKVENLYSECLGPSTSSRPPVPVLPPPPKPLPGVGFTYRKNSYLS